MDIVSSRTRRCRCRFFHALVRAPTDAIPANLVFLAAQSQGVFMHWRFLSLLTLTLSTACSDTWGRGGAIDTAVEQDTRNSLRRRRPPTGLPYVFRAMDQEVRYRRERCARRLP